MRTITLRAYNGDVHTIPYSSIDVVTNMTKDFSFYVFDLRRGLQGECRSRGRGVARDRQPAAARMALPAADAGAAGDRRRRRVSAIPACSSRPGPRCAPGSSGRSGASSIAGSSGASTSWASSFPVPQQKVFCGEPSTESRAGAIEQRAAMRWPARPRPTAVGEGLMRGHWRVRPSRSLAAACCWPAAPRTSGPARRRPRPSQSPSCRRCPTRSASPATCRPSLRRCCTQVAQSAAEIGSRRPAVSRIRQRAERRRAALQQALRAQGYFDGTVVVPDRGRRSRRRRQGMVSEVERLATQPEVVLRVRRRSRRRATGSARLPWTLADNRTASRRRAQASWAWSRASRRVTQPVLDAEQKLLDDARQGGLRAGEARRARG